MYRHMSVPMCIVFTATANLHRMYCPYYSSLLRKGKSTAWPNCHKTLICAVIKLVRDVLY